MKNRNKIVLSLFIVLFSYISTFAQSNIAINNTGAQPDPSAMLDVSATDKGFLMPRITTLQRDAIQNPANGLMIYNMDSDCLELYFAFGGGVWKPIECGCPLPDTPTVNSGSSVNSTSFYANWAAVNGATGYYLDVATDASFNNFVSGYNNLNVGNVTNYNVSGLTCETDYWYRVRAESSCGTSASSGNEKVTSGSCCPGSITSIASPVLTRNWSSTYGVWMEDPLETLGAGKILVIPSYNQSTIYLYNSLSDLSNNTIADQWSLPHNIDGTGAVVYDGYLYYIKENSNEMIKYDLTNKVVDIQSTLTNAGYHNTYAYQWGGFSDIDFAVDENGLWVLYSTSGNSGKMVISELDESTLSVVQTWNTNSNTKNNIGNAFMICGVLYCVDDYNSNTTINYKYDTNTSSDSSISIPFTNPGSYNSMIDYNPRNQLLYSWDSGSLQRYTITF